MGRPSKYTEALADQICEAIATSEAGLHKLCEDNNEFPSYSILMKWLTEHEYFKDKYVRARELQSDFMAEKILEIADFTEQDTINHEKFGDMPNTEWINRSKLRVDTRKWLMSKLAPKKYGEKLDIDHTSGGKPITPSWMLPEKPETQ